MTISVLANGGSITPGANTASISINLGTGANRVLVAWVGHANAVAVLSSLTLGGGAISAGAQASFNSGTRHAYPIAVPLSLTGSQTLQVTFSSNGNLFIVYAVLQGNGALSFGTAVQSAAVWTTNPMSIDITDSTVSSKIVTLFQENTGGAVTPGAGESLLGSFTGGSATFRNGLLSDGGAGTVNVSATFGGTPNIMGMAVAVIEAAANPVITGPSGAAGAANSTANLAENTTQGPTFSTDIALQSGYPTITGADAALFQITPLTSTSWRVDAVAAFNFESLPHANPFVFVFNAAASVSQTCTVTVTDADETPTISAPSASVTSTTTATVGFTTSRPGQGTAYFRRRVGGSPAGAATVVAEGENQVGAANPQTRGMVGFTSGVSVSVDMVHVVDGDESTVVTATFMPGDTTPPTQSGAVSVSNLGATTATLDWADATDNDAVADYEVALSLNGGAYSAIASPPASTYALTGLTSGGTYIVRVRARDQSNNFSAAIFSSAFVPGTAPSVTTQPSSVTVSSGGNASFTSAASGAPAPTGSWQERIPALTGTWTDITGQTGGTLLLNGVTVADNGREFRKQWANALGEVFSNSAILTVTAATAAPSFTTQPVSQSVPASGTMTLTAAAQGVPTPSLQWQRWNGSAWANISGATAGAYSLNNVQISDNGTQFRCVASNGVSPDATSNVATLTATSGGAGTYSALTDVIKDNGIPLANTPVVYNWFPGGRWGALGELVNKTGTTNAAGRLLVTHTAPGEGEVLVSLRRGATAFQDESYNERLTLA
jgi:hypothetical protein